MSIFDIIFAVIMCGILINTIKGVIIGIKYFNTPGDEKRTEEERTIDKTIHASMIIISLVAFYLVVNLLIETF